MGTFTFKNSIDATAFKQNGTDIANIYASLTKLAPVYSSSATYAVGDLCVHDSGFYQCTTAIDVAEAWDVTHWAQTTMSEVIKSTKQLGLEVIDLGSASSVTLTSDQLAKVNANPQNIVFLRSHFYYSLSYVGDVYFWFDSICDANEGHVGGIIYENVVSFKRLRITKTNGVCEFVTFNAGFFMYWIDSAIPSGTASSAIRDYIVDKPERMVVRFGSVYLWHTTSVLSSNAIYTSNPIEDGENVYHYEATFTIEENTITYQIVKVFERQVFEFNSASGNLTEDNASAFSDHPEDIVIKYSNLYLTHQKTNGSNIYYSAIDEDGGIHFCTITLVTGGTSTYAFKTIVDKITYEFNGDSGNLDRNQAFDFENRYDLIEIMHQGKILRFSYVNGSYRYYLGTNNNGIRYRCSVTITSGGTAGTYTIDSLPAFDAISYTASDDSNSLNNTINVLTLNNYSRLMIIGHSQWKTDTDITVSLSIADIVALLNTSSNIQRKATLYAWDHEYVIYFYLSGNKLNWNAGSDGAFYVTTIIALPNI